MQGLDRLWVLVVREARRILSCLLIGALACLPIASYAPAAAQSQPPLWGFVDLHTHPLSNLAFGGKVLYGGIDGLVDAQGNPQGSFLPAAPDCQHNILARGIFQALGHDRSTHGGPVIRTNLDPTAGPLYINKDFNPCGDAVRAKLIHVLQQKLDMDQYGNPHDFNEDSCGLPWATDPTPNFCNDTPFGDWPKWYDVTHQKMWVDWILRAYAGGLRVMVALATNNKLIGDLATMANQNSCNNAPVVVGDVVTLGDKCDLPTDDKTSADNQINEIKRFVANHSNVMEVALGSQDIYRIVSSNKLAVVIGVEIDQIGNFKPWAPPSDALIRAEIDRLYGEGVRYAFPIHLVDNAFGGTAAYLDEFNLANLYEDRAYWNLTCANNTKTDIDIHYQWKLTVPDVGFGSLGQFMQKLIIDTLGIPHMALPLGCTGLKNSLGLQQAGYTAIQEMMNLGMLIDVDHMSQQAVDDALSFVSRPNIRYPVMSGHNAVRGPASRLITERNLRVDQYATIGSLHGMAGVGNAGRDAWDWMSRYSDVVQSMCSLQPNPYVCTISAGFGTDTDGLEIGSPPPTGHPPVKYCPTAQFNCDGNTRPPSAPPSLPISSFLTKSWDYNIEGFAHYGLLPDFLQDARNMPPHGTTGVTGATLVDNGVMNGADYFYHTWKIAESRSKCVSAPLGCTVALGGANLSNAVQLPSSTTLHQITLPALAAAVSSTGFASSPVTDTVTVTSNGAPVAGATVAVGLSTYTTDAKGVAVITHAPCMSGSQVAKVGVTIVPVRTPVPCSLAATASAPGYPPISFTLP